MPDNGHRLDSKYAKSGISHCDYPTAGAAGINVSHLFYT